MRRFFVRNVFFLLLVNLVVKPLWIFGIDRNVQIAVGHETYGQYVALLNFGMVFQILLDFGLLNYNSKTISRSPNVLSGLFPNIMAAKAVLSVAYLLVIMSLGALLGYSGDALHLLLMVGLMQVAQSYLLYLRSNIAALHLFKVDSLLSIGDRMFMILVCSVLLFSDRFAGHFRLEWFVYAQIVAYGVTGLIAYVYCRRLTHITWGRLDLKKVWVVMKGSLPYATLIFLMAIYIRSDVFLLERMLPDEGYEAGVYAASYRILDVANNVTGVLFAGMLLPIFGKMLAKKENVRPLVTLSANLLVPVALATAITAGFFGEEIMKLNLRQMATDYDGRVFFVLMLAFPGYCIGYVYATLLTANGSIRALIFISLVAVALNLGLNFALMPSWGALGAAWACCATQLFLSVANIWACNRILSIRHTRAGALRYFLFVTVMLLGCWAVKRYGFPYHLLWRLGGIGLITLAALSFCGFFPIKRLLQLLKNR